MLDGDSINGISGEECPASLENELCVHLHDCDISLDPVWFVRCGLHFLAPQIFGSKTSWSNLTQAEQVALSETPFCFSNCLNSMSSDLSYDDYVHQRSAGDARR